MSVCVLTAWRFSPLGEWAERAARSRFARQQTPPAAVGGEIDRELWQRSLRYWERFAAADRESPRLTTLGLASYVPRDNLVDLEGRVRGRRPNRSDVIDGVHQLDSVLLRYPERLLRALGIERFVWLSEIVRDGAPVQAFTLPLVMTMVLDPVHFDPGIFHHELFHLIDYRLHGSADPSEWNALNPLGVSYLGIQEYAKRLRAASGPPADNPYFISDYARAAAVEDRAEVFRVLMIDPEPARARIAQNPVIAAKAHYVLGMLDRLAEDSSIALGLR